MASSRDDPSGAQMSSRNRASRVLAVGLPVLVVATAAVAVVAPSDWSVWKAFGLVTPTCWLAWTIWGWPRLTVDERSVTVRNALMTWRIPLREISDIEGGRKFTLSLTNSQRVTAAAISGDGIATEAWRRTDAATQGGHVVRRADDARISQGPPSAASSWAKQLRERVQHAPESARGPITRRVNVGIVVASAAAIALFLTAITVFP